MDRNKIVRQLDSSYYDGKQKKTSSLTLRKEGDKRVLYSYSTPIAYRDEKGNIYLNKTKYSKTTSVQQGDIRRNLYVKEELDSSEFKKKLRDN